MTTASINRSDIFKAAWAEVKASLARLAERGVAARQSVQQMFAYELRLAWNAAKQALRVAALNAAPRDVQLRAAMSDLQNKDRWSDADRAEHNRLAAELRGSQTDADVLDQEEKRDLIESAAGRFASVVFTKKDGTERTMKVQPAALKFHVKGDDANPSARKAAAVRKARHPHLMAVWDVEAKAPRSVNLATVKAITLNGMTYAYQ